MSYQTRMPDWQPGAVAIFSPVAILGTAAKKRRRAKELQYLKLTHANWLIGSSVTSIDFSFIKFELGVFKSFFSHAALLPRSDWLMRKRADPRNCSSARARFPTPLQQTGRHACRLTAPHPTATLFIAPPKHSDLRNVLKRVALYI